MNGSRVEFDSLHTQSADKPINTNQSNQKKVEVISMKAQNIKELGVIDMNKVEACNGRITTFVPIKVIGDELDDLLDTLHADFKKKHPEVEETMFTVHVVYIYGELDSPRYELEIIVWDESNDVVAEFYEEIEVNLSEQAQREVKKAIWDALGKSLFNL